MIHLSKIRLELARMEGFPLGSSIRGYVFIAPLTEGGQIDPVSWQSVPEKCTVIRYWGDEPVKHGLLRFVGNGWRFDYEGLAGQGNQPFFQLDEQVIARGYHISITDHGGIKLPFRVASVECVHNLERAA